MLKVAVIGTGFIGSVHAKNVARHPATELIAVSDVNLESAGKLAASTGAKAVADAAEIFESKEVDAVFVCTSTNTHVDYLKRSAQAGKAVYCEKPIGLDYREAVEAVSVVRTSNVPVMLGFNRRFDPNLPAISYLATSGGQLRDQTVHFFDLLRWITNDEPQEVWPAGGHLNNLEVADIAASDFITERRMGLRRRGGTGGSEGGRGRGR